jgi:hypothetical protein
MSTSKQWFFFWLIVAILRKKLGLANIVQRIFGKISIKFATFLALFKKKI